MKMARIAILGAVLLLPCAAAADPGRDLVDGMARCAGVADNGARLACYDALNPTLKAAQAAPPAVAPPAVAPPSAEAVPPPAEAADSRPWYDPGNIFGVSPRRQTTPQQFGAENLEPPAPPPGAPRTAAAAPPPPLDSIKAAVSSYAFDPYDKFVVFLDNGQIWKQLASDGGKAHFVKGGKNVVVISRGFLSSYDLTVNNGAAYKVKRVK